MNYEVVDMFPTAVYLGRMENHLHHKENFLNNFSNYDLVNSKVVSEPDGNPLLHLDENFDDIFTDISNHIKQYVFNVLGTKKVFDIIITKTWISKSTTAKNDIPWHIHSPSHISFVYYLNYPNNSQKLKFSNKSKSNELYLGMFAPMNIEEANFVEEYNQYNCRTMEFVMNEGTIAVFPSSLSHSTSDADEQFEGLRLAIVGDAILVLKENQLNNYCSFINQKYWKRY